MPENALNHFWQIVFGILTFRTTAFATLHTLTDSTLAALIVVLLAGFSQALGQSIVLFINRVKPIRFLLSLLIAALLFAFEYGFWVLSTWGVSNLVFSDGVDLGLVARILGFSYAPLLFSFLVALPYLGMGLSILLWVWSLLVMVTYLSVVVASSTWEAFACVALGWAVLRILQGNIGRPIMAIGRRMADAAAGVNLVTEEQDLETLLQRSQREGVRS